MFHSVACIVHTITPIPESPARHSDYIDSDGVVNLVNNYHQHGDYTADQLCSHLYYIFIQHSMSDIPHQSNNGSSHLQTLTYMARYHYIRYMATISLSNTTPRTPSEGHWLMCAW